MDFLPESIRNLIHEFSQLPGIGPKTAQRLAFHLLRSQRSLHQRLGNALLKLKEHVLLCENCSNLSDTDICTVCADPSRDHSLICIVEEALDALAVEKSGGYKGTYHVLHGALSPIDGIGPEDLTISRLEERVKNANKEYIPKEFHSPEELKIREIIIATNPTMEGEATALYINKLLKPCGVTITRIACGIPMGGDVEYADQMTLRNALDGRHQYS